jgi:hypothetical protein
MKKMPKKEMQKLCLTIFEDKFQSIIELSKNIIINYKSKVKTGKKAWDSEGITCVVNGYRTSKAFKNKLEEMIEVSLREVYETLCNTREAYWRSNLEYIESKLNELKLIVEIETIKLPKGYWKNQNAKSFKTFKNPLLLGFNNDFTITCGQWIRLSAEEYAEAWVDVLTMANDKIKLIKNNLMTETSSDLEINEPGQEYGNKFKLKVNISKPDLGYLARLLKEAKIIDVPWGDAKEIITWLTQNIKTKNCETITYLSMRKDFFSYADASLDFWEEASKKWHDIVLEHKRKTVQKMEL